jgi:diketogulonate reductase-like aldo/keto reductase
MLIHWPGVKGLKLNDPRHSSIRLETWKHLEEFYIDKSLKAIGVSNYNIQHLEELLSQAKIKPHLLQVFSSF